MLNWMLSTKNGFRTSHRKQVNAPSNMKLVTSLMNFECQSCRIFVGLSYHQEDEVIDTIVFAANVWLGDRINKLVSPNFIGMVISVSIIFDTGATYSCSSNKGYPVNLEYQTLPRNLKGIAKGLDTSGFGIVEYFIRSESGNMIVLRDQAYYVPGLSKDLCIISQQGIHPSCVEKGTFIAHFHDEHDGTLFYI